MDEHILNLKNRLNSHTASNNADASKAQTALQGPDQQHAGQNRALRMGDELITLEPQPILDGQMEVSIPKSFGLMPLEQVRFKYPSEHRPELIFSSLEGTVNITINRTESVLEADKLPEFTEEMADVLRSVQPIRNWMGVEMIVNRSGLSMGMIRFISAGMDVNLFNQMLLFICNGKVAIGGFNCMEPEMEAWMPAAEEMAQSLRIRPSSINNAYEQGVDSL
jgi:hypothetical protein